MIKHSRKTFNKFKLSKKMHFPIHINQNKSHQHRRRLQEKGSYILPS